MRRFAYCVWILAYLVGAGCAKQDESSIFVGPYLGQEPPGLTPRVFAPEIFSKSRSDWAFDATFAPGGNEFYFTMHDRDAGLDRMMCMKKSGDKWTRPVAVSFNSEHNNHNLCIAPDGGSIFYRSWRPLPGNTLPEDRPYLWFVRSTKTGWSEPRPVKCGDTYYRASSPGVARDGTLYFAHRSEKTSGQSDIYRSRFVDGAYAAPENLGSSINTKYLEGDLCVSPDASLMIVSCWDRPDNNGESDLYISFRRSDDTWTELKNVGGPINTKGNENCPALSPDGKYFFYLRVDVDGGTPKCSTHWVSTKIFDRLRPVDVKPGR